MKVGDKEHQSIGFKQLEELVREYPNDQMLGEEIRRMYWTQRDINMTHQEMYDFKENWYSERRKGGGEFKERDLKARATTNNPEGTSVTSQDLDADMELAHRLLEDENRFPGTKSKDYTVHGYDANGSPIEEKVEYEPSNGEIHIDESVHSPHPKTSL